MYKSHSDIRCGVAIQDSGNDWEVLHLKNPEKKRGSSPFEHINQSDIMTLNPEKFELLEDIKFEPLEVRQPDINGAIPVLNSQHTCDSATIVDEVTFFFHTFPLLYLFVLRDYRGNLVIHMKFCESNFISIFIFLFDFFFVKKRFFNTTRLHNVNKVVNKRLRFAK